MKTPNYETLAKVIYEARIEIRELENDESYPTWDDLDEATKSKEVALTAKLLTAHLAGTKVDYRFVIHAEIEVNEIKVDFDPDDVMDTPSGIWEFVSVHTILFNLAMKSIAS